MEREQSPLQTEYRHPRFRDGFSPGQAINGRYTLDRLIGVGGGGQVWRCTDEMLSGRLVALKICPERINVEEGLIQLRHLNPGAFSPHLIEFEDSGIFHTSEASYYYATMEHLDGPSIEKELIENGPFTILRALVVLRKTAHALNSLHSIKLVHNDIKPSNLMTNSEGVLRERLLSDCPSLQGKLEVFFEEASPGLLRFRPNAEQSFLETELSKLEYDTLISHYQESRNNNWGIRLIDLGTVSSPGYYEHFVGTRSYLPPEKALHGEIRKEGDLYSLGISFYQMLSVIGTDNKNFRGNLELIGSGLASNDIEHYPESIKRILFQTMASRPGNRVQSCEELIDLIDDAIINLSGSELLSRLNQTAPIEVQGTVDQTTPIETTVPASPPLSSIGRLRRDIASLWQRIRQSF